MCGRYRMTRADKLAQQFEAELDAELSVESRYNVAPGQRVAIVRQREDRPARRVSAAKWGLVPSWAKDPNIGFKMINARSETIAEKPAYRQAFLSRRCLVPADGFYEWKREGKSKQPFHFGMADDSIFAMAAIWERWRSPQGEWLETCSILTTTPNALLHDVHDRMPVIIPREAYELWLDPAFKNKDELVAMLRPYDAARMRRYPVSTRVNAVKYDDPECCVEVRAAGA